MKPPRILSTKEVFKTPWVRLVEKSVDFGLGDPPADYVCLAPRDYVAIVAVTPENKILLVHQYRPSVEQMTCEIPAGLLEKDETPDTCCRRELEEETGYRAVDVKYLGAHFPDSGRLTNQMHTYYVKVEGPLPNFKPEPGISVELVTPARLRELVVGGKFPHLLHVAALMLAELKVGVFSPRASS